MAQRTDETEIKLPVTDLKAARERLRRAGFRVWKRRVFEVNRIFDTAELALRESKLVLRVREAGKVHTLTYKGKPTYLKHKSREELEMRIPDAGMMTRIFERLGYRPVFRYEKYRTEYRQPEGDGVATLDETPVGNYLELEGVAAWIDRSAEALGFSERDYITASYAMLYRDWCEKHGIEATHMVFESGKAEQP